MYRLIWWTIYALSLLPLRVLYGLSDLAYWGIYRGIGYRRRIVREQLQAAFPEKSPSQIRQMKSRFYRNFFDQWVETLKLASLSPEALARRLPGNWDLLEELRLSGKNVCIYLGHQFNWEWANLATQWQSRQDFAGVYLPLESGVFDRVMQKIRQRGGGYMISMKASRAGFSWLKERQHILGLIADQNPSRVDQSFWIPFMGRPAPFFKGAESLGRRPGTQPVFLEILREGRGQYRAHLEIMEIPPQGWGEPGNLMRDYVLRLEKSLGRQPENWMWTHRRWKHSPPPSASSEGAEDPGQEQRPSMPRPSL